MNIKKILLATCAGMVMTAGVTAETDDIETAMNELGDDFTEEEIRLVRIKYMSDNAN